MKFDVFSYADSIEALSEKHPYITTVLGAIASLAFISTPFLVMANLAPKPLPISRVSVEQLLKSPNTYLGEEVEVRGMIKKASTEQLTTPGYNPIYGTMFGNSVFSFLFANDTENEIVYTLQDQPKKSASAVEVIVRANDSNIDITKGSVDITGLFTDESQTSGQHQYVIDAD